MEIWLLPLLAAICSALLTIPVRHWLKRRGLVDRPDPRRSHTRPTPRGGGLAVMAALVIMMIAWPLALQAWWQPMMLVVAMAALGWLDDRRDLAPGWRLGGQAVMVAIFIWLQGGIASVSLGGYEWHAIWLWTFLGGIAAVWLINMHNFMDGSDGLAAMQGVWTSVVMGVLLIRGGETGAGMFGLAIAGVYAGFLVWNRPPARVFMGDVGSLALGAAVACMALVGAASGTVSIWISLMVSSLFVVDSTATLLSRLGRGEQWYTAHRQHAYQRLLEYGWSHGGVLFLYTGINLLIVLPAVLVGVTWPHSDILLTGGLVVFLVAGWWVIQSATRTEKDKAST